MSNFMLELNVSLKKFFRKKINQVIILLILILGFNVWSYCETTQLIDKNDTKIRKKIDHRYFNTTTSLEQIFNIKINTLNGELKQAPPKVN